MCTNGYVEYCTCTDMCAAQESVLAGPSGDSAAGAPERGGARRAHPVRAQPPARASRARPRAPARLLGATLHAACTVFEAGRGGAGGGGGRRVLRVARAPRELVPLRAPRALGPRLAVCGSRSGAR